MRKMKTLVDFFLALDFITLLMAFRFIISKVEGIALLGDMCNVCRDRLCEASVTCTCLFDGEHATDYSEKDEPHIAFFSCSQCLKWIEKNRDVEFTCADIGELLGTIHYRIYGTERKAKVVRFLANR
jgi:hypothetical protein